MTFTIWYHDPAEVDPKSSWTGLVSSLEKASRQDIRSCHEPKITRLFEYARPDAVVSLDDMPLISIEQTMMNPSGHNIPQRFSCLVKAAELGIPSVLYYPEKSRRTFSDPNVRYINIRVLLAQFRLMQIYQVPSLSLFWPINLNLLPRTDQTAQENLAEVVEAVIQYTLEKKPVLNLLNNPIVLKACREMDRIIKEYSSNDRYPPNDSIRKFLPNGFPETRRNGSVYVDPPPKVLMMESKEILKQFSKKNGYAIKINKGLEMFLKRKYALYFTGTANRSKTDSEHPWPGYLTLIDIMYARTLDGKKTLDRTHNLVYELPVSLNQLLKRTSQPTTSFTIVDNFSDIIIASNGAIYGKSLMNFESNRTISSW